MTINGFDYLTIEEDPQLIDTVKVYKTSIWEKKEAKSSNQNTESISYQNGELLCQLDQNSKKTYFVYTTNPFLAYTMLESDPLEKKFRVI